MGKPTIAEMCEGFVKTYPAAITDIMDTEFNLHNQWLGPEINPLLPEMSVAGPAMTMRWIKDPVTINDEAYEKMAKQLVDELKPNIVPVIDSSKCQNAGFWGELMCTICNEKGVKGAVIDGGVRDPLFIAKSGFNMFAAFPCPLEANFNRAQLESVQKPILINGVVIRPGDFIVGDFGGVVVVPQEVVVEVYEKVNVLVEQESETRRLIREGASVKAMLAAGGRL